ncbi:SDR family oxidoreductase [Oricola sp.]|uniref:SDR family NAD(P)-dependent oxidoreductase n=1 Tax=Oricola sp. TaxID=1979950 RepID=UPI0025F4FF83|nr:SDR family oxidoreductase [Oricola sp.]MCI5078522.1 SDR family oxidoreductase [Oricola sp.]
MARRKILVTGGTDGIGLELVRRLADRHDVIATGRRPRGQVAASLPEDVIYLQADQSAPEEAAQAIVRGLLEHNQSRLDHAILNAGTGYAVAPQTETAEAIRRTLDVNVVSAIALAHALFPFLERAEGQLTFIGSVAARRGSSRFSSYAASKAALDGLARALGAEWRGTVRVQVLHPGPTRTAIHAKAGLELGWIERFFLPPETMAAMLETAIQRGRSPETLSLRRYLAGGSMFGSRIQ